MSKSTMKKNKEGKKKKNVQFKEEQSEAWAESEEETPDVTWVKTTSPQSKTPPS